MVKFRSRSRTVRATFLSLALAAALVVPTMPAAADPMTFTVTKTADTADGTCDADCSLREAVTAANGNAGVDTIVVPAGTYTLTIATTNEDANADGDLDVTEGVVIDGDGSGTTIVDASGVDPDATDGNGDRVLDIHNDVDVTVSGLTLTGGDVTGDGGGVRHTGPGSLTINDSVLDANFATNDGGGAAVSEAALTVRNGEVTNNEGSQGPGLYSGGTAGVPVNVLGVTLSGNTGGDGAGVYVDQGDVLQVQSSTFDSNSASSDGGGIYAEDAVVNIMDSTFTSNDASSGAGLYCYYCDATISRTGLDNNSASSDGGGVYNSEGTTSFSEVTFDTNDASDGGALYVEEGISEVDDVTFTGNTASYGGAVQLYYYGSSFVGQDVAFDGNSATSDGGAVYFEDEGMHLELTNAEFTNNSADNEGGAIYADYANNVLLTDSVFDSNSSLGDGGAIYAYTYNQVRLTRTDLTNNTSGDEGGAIYVYEENSLQLRDVTISTNTADADGGGIYLDSSNQTDADGLEISGNTATTGDGGGLYADYENASTFYNMTVTGNTAELDGGGLSLPEDSPTLIEGGTVSGNTATTGDGGGIWTYGYDGVIFRDVEVTDNAASAGDGGGIFVSDSSSPGIVLEDSVVSGNAAAFDGGGLYLYYGPNVIRRTEITGNSAGADAAETGWGGGIYDDSCYALRIEDSVISGNSADEAGGIYFCGSAAFRLHRSSVAQNTATEGDGGGLYLDSSTGADIRWSLLAGNQADGGLGGGIYASTDANVLLTNTTLSGNGAATDGGGVYASGASVRTALTTINGNTSGSASGGGVFNSGGYVVLKSTLLQANTSGGAAENCAGDPVVTHGANIADDATCGLDGAGDLEDTDALLAALADNGGPTQTHALQAGSPAIDHAGSTCTDAGDGPEVTTDQRLAGRPIDGDASGTAECDVGAFEFASGVTVVATDPSASEDGPDTGTFTFTRQGTSGDLTVFFSIGGTATNDADYQEIAPAQVTIPDGSASATVTVTPKADNAQEGAETVIVTITPDESYAVGVPNSATVTVADMVESTLRLSGDDRFETAIAISGASFGDGEADAVVIARSDEYADALAGAPLAHQRNAPILITPPGELLPSVAAELQRVLDSGRTVYILGGPVAVSEDVEKAIDDLGYPTRRIFGSTRIETAIAIARALGNPSSLLVTTGYNFPDALAAGAAAAHIDGAVLLTTSEDRHPSTDAYLDSVSGETLYAIGGPAARPYSEATPLFGDDRFETAVVTAEAFFTDPFAAGLARQDVFADALTGGPHIAGYGGPILLTASDVLRDVTAQYLCDESSSLQQAFAYGGPVALNQGVIDAAEDRIQGTGC